MRRWITPRIAFPNSCETGAAAGDSVPVGVDARVGVGFFGGGEGSEMMEVSNVSNEMTDWA